MGQTAICSLDLMFPFIYEYPQMGLVIHSHTHTHSLPPQLPLTYLCPPTDHSLAGIYGTLVICYIYPLRLLSILIVILCEEVHFGHHSTCLHCSHNELFLAIAVVTRGTSLTKIIILF